MRMTAARYGFVTLVLLTVGGLLLSARRPALAVPATSAAAAGAKSSINFNRDIRPILSENCFACHGPDARQRKAKLRLDLADSATHPAKSGAVPITPGDLDHSELFARITTDDADDHMPPAESGKKLTPAQIDLLRRWIKDGAVYQGLWSLILPARPELPQVSNAAWPRNPIDRFILARLEKEGLAPAPEADRPTLIRRLSQDLLGLPPTPAEVDAFVADRSPDAYEKLVDRLVASPHYGERMTLDWLDAARFGDTHGYHIDSARDMTAWRDWVINAFNTNKPFDQFTIEQIAGDLLPGASIDQRIASGFHRNNMVNFEGGAIPEEYQAAYNIDRVNTTAAVWLGLTLGCCQCHDHKFDPFTQKDFYQLYAFFNGIAEKGLDGKNGNAVPVLQIPTPEQQVELDKLGRQAESIRQRLDAPNPDWDAAQAKWESEEISAAAGSADHADWLPADPQPSALRSAAGATLTRLDDQSILASGRNPATDTYTVKVLSSAVGITGVRIEVLPDESLKERGPGRSVNGNLVLTELRLGSHAINDAIRVRPVKIKSVVADFAQDAFPADGVIDGKSQTGWAIYPQVGKPHSLTLALEEPINSPGGALLVVTLEFKSHFAQHTAGRFRILTTTSPNPLGAGLKPPPAVAAILSLKPAQRTPEQQAAVRSWFRENRLSDARPIREQLVQLRRRIDAYRARVRTTQVMAEMPRPRDTFILVRGQYDKHGDLVTANTPAALPPLPAGQPHDRLALARWLVDPANPLTARVTVNRFWQMYFGIGLVKTAEDFGVQGEFPSHPELLDWLATEFIARKWDVKAMQRLIVTSATYRQSSRAVPAAAGLIARDPENRLLARGPRFRLAAEFVRDQALAVSGLLNPQIGGKSVNPYQPPGLWEELMSRSDGDNFTAQTYVQDHGPDLYRRGMYTFWKRTCAPASLSTFDAPDRQICTVRRSRTNTPLQALILMNDPTYVEAARALAQRALTDPAAGQSDDQRITYIMQLALSRAPRPAELAILRNTLDRQLSTFRSDPKAAAQLLAVGESKRNPSLDPAQHAAWTMLSTAILNLDETITKN